MAVYGDESVTISQLKTILTASSSGGGSQAIEAHNTDPNAHEELRNTANGAAHTAVAALKKAEEALELGASGGVLIPFRIEVPKCINPSSTTSLNTNTGPWVRVGNWEIASFYSSSNFIIGGVYNDDMIQITGVSTDYIDNSDTCLEFIENYILSIKRIDGVETKYNAPEGGVAAIALSDPSATASGVYIGNAQYMYWPHYISGEQTSALKLWAIAAISTEEGTALSYNGRKKYNISSLSLNFSICRKDKLKTDSD